MTPAEEHALLIFFAAKEHLQPKVWAVACTRCKAEIRSAGGERRLAQRVVLGRWQVDRFGALYCAACHTQLEVRRTARGEEP